MLRPYILALDIGGTKINAGFVSPLGKVIARQRTETQAKKTKSIILKNIFKIIDSLLIQAKTRIKVLAMGIGIAGYVDYKKGIFRAGPNFSQNFKNISLKNILRKKYKLPVFLDNDARCFTLGEAIFGRGKNYRYIIGLTLGTGIGGGIIIDKKIYRGKDNVAGEFGHMIIDLDSQKCSCQKFGHFEALASGLAISKMYNELAGKTADARQIEEKAKLGQKSAKLVLAKASKNLGIGLANLANTLNPEIIILGGGLIRSKRIWQPIQREIKKQNPFSFPLTTKIVKAKLGDDANLLGAALMTGKIKISS